MSKLRFTPEDFLEMCDMECREVHNRMCNAARAQLAANVRLAEMLPSLIAQAVAEAPVVYAERRFSVDTWLSLQMPDDTHRARLVNVERIDGK